MKQPSHGPLVLVGILALNAVVGLVALVVSFVDKHHVNDVALFSPGVGLDFAEGTTSGLSTSGRARLVADSTSHTMQLSQNGAAYHGIGDWTTITIQRNSHRCREGLVD